MEGHSQPAGVWVVRRTEYTTRAEMRNRLAFGMDMVRRPEVLAGIVSVTQSACWAALGYRLVVVVVGSSYSNKDLDDWDLSIPLVAAHDHHCPEAVSGEGEEILT